MASDFNDLASRFTAVWNESDDGRRRKAIAELWSTDGVEYISSGSFRGHDQLEQRVSGAHKQFVEDGGFVFTPVGDATGHSDTVVFRVAMAPKSGGDVVWTGTIVAHTDDTGRITSDYQFARP